VGTRESGAKDSPWSRIRHPAADSMDGRDAGRLSTHPGGAIMSARPRCVPAGPIDPPTRAMPRHWLIKSEPGAYSIHDLERDGSTSWNGVRNYQARNFMRDEMAVGDPVLFYHSNAAPPGVAGIARVSRAAYPDPTARDPASDYFDPKAGDDDPRWFMVDVAFVERFPALVPLDVLRATPGLEKMPVNNRSRLSVQPVTAQEFEIVARLGRE
jgi:predicted RNA-binding protein with PUA-like domain